MQDIEELSNSLKALSDPTRLKIITMLRKRECMLCVNAISFQLGITQSAVSQHLKILKQARLVRSERKGYYVHYSIEKENVMKVCTSLLEKIN